jgi:hypothetical protein
MIVVVVNIINFQILLTVKSQIHGLNTRRNLDLYSSQTNLTVYQIGPYYFGIKLFNHVPLNIKELAHDTKQFSKALYAFLCSKLFIFQMKILIKIDMASFINMWNLYHAYAQYVNTAIGWAWYRGFICLLVMLWYPCPLF